MSDPLFRPEALQARRRGWLGGVSLAQPLSLWLLAGFAALAAAAVLCFLAVGDYTRRSRVTGQLVPDLGLATVVAPVDGVLAGRMPREGERVVRDQALAVIAVQRATSGDGDTNDGLRAELMRRREAVEQVHDAQDLLLAAQARGYTRQLRSTRRELAQVEAGIATRREQVRLAQETLARYRDLAARRYVSAVELQRQERSALESRATLQAMQRQATALRRDIVQLEQGLREVPAQRSARDAEHADALAQLEQERLRVAASGEVLVQAPVAGLIASRLVEPGQAVQAGQPLLSLLPAGATLQAQLLVPSRAVGFIEPGDTVLLRYQAFPYQKFGHHRGTVVRVSRSALTPGGLDALVGHAQAGEPYYRVLVDLSQQTITAYGQPEPLRPGMLLEADILGERRKLYEWMLEPLYSLTGQL